MNHEKQLADLEAALFVHGEPLSFQKIVSLLGMNAEDVGAFVEECRARLNVDPARGLTLVISEEKVQLVTKPDVRAVLDNFVKVELKGDLTPAAQEALSLVAYLGPISRSRLEYLRGVNSMFILRSLLLRGLVSRHPDPARPISYLYTPSFEFLRFMGVGRQEELPEYEKYKTMFASFDSPAETGGFIEGGSTHTEENTAPLSVEGEGGSARGSVSREE